MDQGRIEKIISDTFWEELPGILWFLAVSAVLILAVRTLLSESQIYCAVGILVALLAAAWWVLRDPRLCEEADKNSRNIR